jgi:ABC-type sugar transport system ATPase subunit
MIDLLLQGKTMVLAILRHGCTLFLFDEPLSNLDARLENRQNRDGGMPPTY